MSLSCRGLLALGLFAGRFFAFWGAEELGAAGHVNAARILECPRRDSPRDEVLLVVVVVNYHFLFGVEYVALA